MSKILFLALLAAMLAGCNNKPASVNDEDKVLTYTDFRDLFPTVKPPYRLGSDSLQRRQADSLAFRNKVVTQFLPDTMARGSFKPEEKPKFFGRAYIKAEELDYYVIEGAAKSGRVAWLCFYNKDGKFLKRHVVTQLLTGNKVRRSFQLDGRSNIRVITETQRGGGHVSTREDVYAVTPDGSMALILTNSNEPASAGLYNPIDTLPRKHKLSGNYTAGEMNLVSVRDGENPKEFLFYIHFSRDKGACTGELDGVGRFTGTNTGQYRDKGSSCIIDFTFGSGKVTIKETGCGAYRGIKCFFEGTYTRKKSK